jgi:hypothetical protein
MPLVAVSDEWGKGDFICFILVDHDLKMAYNF